MRSTLLLLALLLPTSAAALTLEERVEQRRQARLAATHQAEPVEVIRFGRTVQPRTTSPRRLTRSETGTVTRVVDGSVIVVQMTSGTEYQVRTLGAEAPLLRTGSTKDQCYAQKSKQALENLLLGQTVRLQRDENYQYDNTRRLLRYVYLGTHDMNAYMISQGFSFADDENTHRKSASYSQLEQEARENDIGLWNDFCTYNPNPSRTIEILEP